MNVAEVNTNAALVSDIPKQAQAVSQDTPAFERLIGMLEKVLLQAPGYAQANRRQHTSNKPPKIEGFMDMSCSICNDSSHSAFIHCRENRLCFLCHLPGHPRRECPERRRPPHYNQQGN